MLVAGAVGLLVAVVAVLLSRAPAEIATNGVRPVGFVAEVPGQAEICDRAGGPRPGAEAVALTFGLDGRPPQRVRLRVEGGPSGPVATAVDGVTRVGLAPATSLAGRRLCLRNLGQEPVVLAGEQKPGATLGGEPQAYRVSFTFLDAAPPRRWELAAGALRDVGNARAGAGGPVTGWLAAALAIAALGVALGGTWRVLR